MSTKVTIQHLTNEDGSGYHLYWDCLDSFGMDEKECPVYLELNGVEFTASSPGNLQMRIPREWAIKLGLVSTEENSH